MPRFAYTAIDAAGSSVEGVLKASTLGEARNSLLAKNLYPVKIEEKRGALQFEISQEKVKKKELMHFTRQLSVFVRAGIPITEALDIIGDETADVALRRTIVDMTEDLRNGGTLSDAARKHPEAFPNYYMGILQSAELTGKLDAVPKPKVDRVDPPALAAAEGGELTILGRGFIPGATVTLADQPLETVRRDAVTLVSTLPPGLVAAGTHPLVVTLPTQPAPTSSEPFDVTLA